MRVYRCPDATGDIIALSGKHRKIMESIEQFERLLAADMTPGHERIPNLGLSRDGIPASIWKGRVLYPPLGGKRQGPRYIYERVTVENTEYAIALVIYLHKDHKDEVNGRELACKRFELFDGTPNGLRRLELSPVD